MIEYAIGEHSIQTLYNPTCIQPIEPRAAAIYLRRLTDTVDPMKRFGYNSIPKCFGLLDTSAVDAVGVFRLRTLPYINLSGRNVILGFLDTGIDYTHKVFINADNSSRVVAIWDQTIESGTRPEVFDYGSEYLQDDITNAIRSENPLLVVPSTDTNGHGTFLAGVAAGNIEENDDFSGIAPLAQIAVVKLKQAKPYLREYYGISPDVDCYQENDIMMAIRYLFSVAARKNLPLVICLGIGSNAGGHEGTSFLDGYIQDLASTIGICVCCAGGNEGNLRHHYFDSVLKKASQNIEIEVAKEDTAFTVELWNNQPGSLSVGFLSPGGELIEKIPVRYNSYQQIKLFPEPTVIDVNYDPDDVRSGDAVVQMRFHNVTSGIWTIVVYNDTEEDIMFHLWLPMEHFISPNTYFIRPNPDTTLTSVANGTAEISVSAYNHQTNGIYLNSSRGYTRRGRIKPDIAAPGVNVFGPGINNTYTTKTGTSISSSITAGLSALLFEWAFTQRNMLNIRGNTVRQLFIRGAEKQDIVYPNKEWGNGSVNIYNVFQNIRTPS